MKHIIHFINCFTTHPCRVITLLILTFLSGCATAGVPSGSTAESINPEKKTIVLLRIRATVNEKFVDTDHYHLRIASVDRNEPLKQIYSPMSPTSDRRNEGWIYFLLDPGETYHLSVLLSERYVMFKAMFRLPRDQQVVYIGTFYASCTGNIPDVLCTKETFIDERELANSVAQEAFSQYGPPLTHLMSSLPLRRASLKQYSPLGITSTFTEGIVGPDWTKRGVNRTTGIEGVSPMIFLPPFTLLSIYYLLYLPVGATTGFIGGIHSEYKWQPCIEKLAKNLQTLDPPNQLKSTLLTELQKRGFTNIVQITAEKDLLEKARQSGLKAILKTDVGQVAFMECAERWNFRVDINSQASLLDVSTGNCLYKEQYSSSSACRKIDDYCGEKGTVIIREELNKAINASVSQLLNDLNP